MLQTIRFLPFYIHSVLFGDYKTFYINILLSLCIAILVVIEHTVYLACKKSFTITTLLLSLHSFRAHKKSSTSTHATQNNQNNEKRFLYQQPLQQAISALNFHNYSTLLSFPCEIISCCYVGLC